MLLKKTVRKHPKLIYSFEFLMRDEDKSRKAFHHGNDFNIVCESYFQIIPNPIVKQQYENFIKKNSRITRFDNLQLERNESIKYRGIDNFHEKKNSLRKIDTFNPSPSKFTKKANLKIEGKFLNKKS